MNRELISIDTRVNSSNSVTHYLPKAMLGAILIVAIVSVAVISRFNSQVTQYQTTILQLSRLDGTIFRLSALEWQTIANGKVGSETEEALAEMFAELDETLVYLHDSERELWSLASVRARSAEYRTAVTAEFDLLSQGRLEEAETLDEEQVDPRFEELRETVAATSDSFDSAAIALIARARAGIFAAMVLAASLIVGLFRASLRMQLDVEHVESERLAVEKTNQMLRTQMKERREAARKQAELRGQLQQSQKIEAIGVLAGGIAHDFNNLLAAIMGHAELAKSRTPLDCRSHKNLDTVLQAGKRATDVVKQLLTFSRRSQGEVAAIQLEDIIEESVRFLRASIPPMVRISTDFQPGSASVLADGTQMSQVVVNLCTNSYHAIGDNHGEIVVGLRTVDAEESIDVHGGTLVAGRYVEFSVSDTGAGMDAETQSHIFDPFYTTKGVGKGTGLGLAVVHGIVTTAHGGMTVNSRPGVGTTFVIYMPAYDAVELEAASERAEGAPAVIGGGGTRIMLVDDEAMVAGMAAEVLEDLGYAVTVFLDPGVALSSFRADPFRYDLVITDFTMPTMSGPTLATAIRQLRPALPILVSTGSNKGFSAKEAGELGFAAFLLKPYEIDRLGAAVASALGATQATV